MLNDKLKAIEFAVVAHEGRVVSFENEI